MIIFHNVLKSFSSGFNKHQALHQISCQIDITKRTLLLGENGSGKTTFLKLLCGYLRPSSGQVINPLLLREMAYLPEKFLLEAEMTGKDFLMSLKPKELVIDEAYLDFFKIKSFWEKKIKTYSKGMTQKMGILALCMHNPRFLVMDEPMDGLDQEAYLEFIELLNVITQKNGGYILTSHNISDLKKNFDNVILLKKGHLLFVGSAEDYLGYS